MGRRVIVLGGGYGGLCAAAALRNLLAGDDEIVVVDRKDEQVLGLSLLWVMRGWRSASDVTVKPSAVSALGVEFLQHDVTSIDTEGRRVVTSGGELAYDALVVALGAERVPHAIPGLAEALESDSGGHYYTLEAAARLRETAGSFRGGRACVVVCSLPFTCPAAPYEGAMLLADLWKEKGLVDVQIDVFTPEPAPMPVAGPAVGDAVTGMLREKGIALHPGRQLESVDAGGRRLEFTEGPAEGYDFLVAIPPHRPPAAVGSLKGPSGWIPIDRRTAKTGTDAVWAIGDVTGIVLANGRPLPKAGVFAAGEAEAAARSIAGAFGYDAAEPGFDGEGWCWVEAGDGLAAYASGRFFAEPDPEIDLHETSAEHHEEKEAEERRWLERWRS